MSCKVPAKAMGWYDKCSQTTASHEFNYNVPEYQTNAGIDSVDAASSHYSYASNFYTFCHNMTNYSYFFQTEYDSACFVSV